GEYLAENYRGKGTLIINGEILKKVFPQLLPGRAWFLFQSALIILSLLFCTKRAKTIEQLAHKCGLPAEKLHATVDAYNNAIASHEEDSFGKSDEFRHSLGNGPYYAIDISIGNPVFMCATLTFGGLQVDERTGQVKKAEGGAFKNLYAAGRSAVGIPSRSYVSGLSLADCIFSGRRAGRHIAETK
ncbi:MAG: FAD-binding protein, partial [Pseudomonadales bacterium]